MRVRSIFLLCIGFFIVSTISGYTETKTQVLRVATVTGADSSEAKGLFHFKKLVEERTQGLIKVDIYTDGVLGNEESLVEGIQMGTVDGVVIASFKYSLFVPEMEILNLPFLFSGEDHWRETLYGPVGKKLGEFAYQRRGDTVLGYMTEGARNIFSRKELLGLPGLKGLKIRVMPTPLEVMIWRALGAEPRAVAQYDLNAALQTGLIDAAEDNFVTIKKMKFYEPPNKYILRTEHRIPTTLFILGKLAYERLPEDLKAVVVACGREAALGQVYESFAANRETEAELVNKYWVKVIDLTPEERRVWVEKVAPLQEKIVSELGLDKIRQEIRESIPSSANQ